jgi:signal transduction histidine kinase/CheY-like chemotaxis protein
MQGMIPPLPAHDPAAKSPLPPLERRGLGRRPPLLKAPPPAGDLYQDGAEYRVLILAPTGRDAALARAVVSDARIEANVCGDMAQLVDALRGDVGAVLLAEEALDEQAMGRLAGALGEQPSWSDLPLLILTRPGADSPAVASALDELGNVTLLERPVRIASLVSTLRAALRARRRQYEMRTQLRDRELVAEKLKRADRRKDEFLATLAHELRNPLAPIRNSLHIVRQAGLLHPPTAQVCQIMERQVDHMVRLVDDLLELSRITRGQIELRRQPVELASVLRAAVETSDPLIRAGRHSLRLELPPQPLWLDADPVRMAQVFSNLLNNAAKYMDDGGSIEVAGTVVGGRVEVRVRDHGVGIEADMLGSVFDMFTQGEPPRRTLDGLGIGLTLVRSLVGMHGGEVEARSEGRGCGSEFVVSLPLAAAPCSAAAAAHDGAPARLPERIVVVDDNRDAADSLGMYLQLSGAEVEVVHDGRSALRLIERFRPQVVLLDIGMPEMDGHEVARRIRAQPAFDGTVLIALTGWGQDKDLQASREAGIDHHLVKPVDLEHLQRLLGTLTLPSQPAGHGQRAPA